VRVGAPTLVRKRVSSSRREGKHSAELVEGLIAELGVAVVPFGEVESRLAVRPSPLWARRHPGVVETTATASRMRRRRPRTTRLLFVGEDFTKTDIAPA